ncbi:MAG: cation diffusion facilitator family transporter [Actinobacteria bacterium]|nr:cation diffusion facilitator family transporter [Actinomycetota bacterium]
MEHSHQPKERKINTNNKNISEKYYHKHRIDLSESAKKYRAEYPGEHSHTHVFRSFERKRLLTAIILTGTMMIAELTGGFITGSLALLSDAGHMFTHAFALLISFLAILYAARPATKERSFGFYRVEIIAALFNGITLLAITVFIVWEAYKRIINPQPVSGKGMFIIAVIGLIVNIITALILWKASRESLNVRSAFTHMIGDAGSSVGVVIGAIIIYFTDLYIVDSIFSIIIAILILIWSISLIRDSVRILMESTPKDINMNLLKKSLIENMSEIRDVHDLHVWEITTGMYCMTAHIIIKDMNVSRTEKLLHDINVFLEDSYNIQHPIIQFETGNGFSHDYED